REIIAVIIRRSSNCNIRINTYWGGVIFGSVYSADFRTPEFVCIERKEDLCRLKGSKYAETSKRVFHEGEYRALWPLVAEKLESGLTVLFTGLGCDVAALKSFLKAKGTDTSRLYTLDLICYGSTLQEVHRQYIANLESKFKSRVINFTVRYKKHGWTPPYIFAEFENGRKFDTDFYASDYGKAFALYARRPCYNCNFRGNNHQSDITVGDFWGVNSKMEGWNKNGVSIMLVRTDKGEELIRGINAQEFSIHKTDAEFAVSHNGMYHKRREKLADYDKFCEDLKSIGLHKAIVNHYGFMKYYFGSVKSCVKRFIPGRIRRIIKAVMRVI
ncbi:MAG: Coenzyme F420 hydrogenase/dehydrogenase, beta subunit C-terminal domain, partial [Synergistaceae bacterium]|nr:Coenzyme F420 hydrogenase/dehydrogenase, beta subunit C-terminal domain [Synergistaceae bacterium]